MLNASDLPVVIDFDNLLALKCELLVLVVQVVNKIDHCNMFGLLADLAFVFDIIEFTLCGIAHVTVRRNDRRWPMIHFATSRVFALIC